MATIAPITIKEAFVGSKGFPKIAENTIVSVVARVTRVLEQNKYKIVFELRDLTGKINATFWLDEYVPAPIILVNNYIQIYGTLEKKEQETKNGKPIKELLVFKLFQISEVDTITCHYLQCFHKKHMDPFYCEKVLFNYIKEAETKSENIMGIKKKTIYENSELRKIMSQDQIENTLYKLWDYGYIYSTTDEEHFKNTTAFDCIYFEAK